MRTIKRIQDFFRGRHLSEEHIAIYSEYLHQDGSIPLPRHRLEHVENCLVCKEKILDVFLFLKDFPPVQTPFEVPGVGSLSKKLAIRRPLLLHPVFSMLLLIVSAVLILYVIDFRFFSPGARHRDGQSVTKVDRTPGKPEAPPSSAASKPVGGVFAKLPADRFAINTSLESMVGSSSRSPGFQVISPGNMTVFRRDILFSWQIQTETAVLLKIVDNQDTILYSLKIDGSQYRFTRFLPEGLFYWKLESADDLLHVGKFLIRND